ncbi:MAG: hypothetical protein WA921_14630 [Ahrensia sp.]
MSDSIVIVGIVLLLIVLIGVFFMAWQRPRPMFANRQAVQQAVENHLKRYPDLHGDVAWCAAGEDGLYGVFELRDGRYGIVRGSGSGSVVQFLRDGDIKNMVQSKDGFGLFISLSKMFSPKIKLVFDDIATAAYARNLLTKPRH